MIRNASKAKVPDSVQLYNGFPIIRVKHKLDFNKYATAYRDTLHNWFLAVAEDRRLPQANETSGHELGADLLLKLLECTGARQKKAFEIGLLKLSGVAGSYDPIDKDLSSGGEGLTSAVLLYSVINQFRAQQRRHEAQGHALGMLALDNPLANANKASLVQAQLETCASFGLQPIIYSGIGDIPALEQFDKRILITRHDGSHGGGGVRFDNKKYRRVRVTNAHLSKAEAVS